MSDGKQFENKGNGEKDKWEILDLKWREGMMSAPDDQLNDRIAESAKIVVEKQIILKTDPEVLDLKNKLKEKTFNDREDIKVNKKKIEFLNDVLKSRGKT